jgi:hypothetical protein
MRKEAAKYIRLIELLLSKARKTATYTRPISYCLYQLNNTGELYPGARNTYSIVCSLGWW